MDHAQYADRIIAEAVERGDLDPASGAGRPLPEMTPGPDWWVRAFVEREGFPQRHAEAVDRWSNLTSAAVGATDLASARVLLERANRHVEAWNASAPPEFTLPRRSEVWLLDERARRPAE